MASPVRQATQEVLGALYEKTDKAIGFADCLFHASFSPSSGVEDKGLSVVAKDLATQLKAIRATLHDLVAWVG